MIINMNGAKAPETPSPVMQEKTVTPETLPTVIGADEGYDGLSQVTVNPDANLKSENIKYGKTVFGVQGSYGRQFEGGNIEVGGGAGATSDKEFVFKVDFSEYPRQLTFDYPADIPQGMVLDPTTVKCNRPDFLLPARVPEHLIWLGVRGTSPWHMFNTQRGHKPDSFPYVITPAKEYRTMEDPINGTKMVRTFTLTYDEEVVNAPDNLTPENIKAGVTIAGVTGTYEPQPSEVTLETVVTTPESFPTVVTPSAGYDGLSRVTVQSPDNLSAENIKAGVSIAGVTGTYSGGGSTDNNFGALVSRSINHVTADMLNGVTKIGSDAFRYCKYLYDVAMPNTITSIGDRAFDHCEYLRSVNMSTAITSIGTAAFQYCQKLTSIDIPSGVTSIGTYAFTMSYITSITLPDTVTSVGANAFSSCYQLTSAVLSNGIKTIPEELFRYDDKLANVTLPIGLTSIGNSAFSGCKALTSIEIPSTVTSIKNYAFSGATNLSTLTMKPTSPPTIGANTFSTGITSIIVPSGSLEAYQTATNWSKYADYMTEATE